MSDGSVTTNGMSEETAKLFRRNAPIFNITYGPVLSRGLSRSSMDPDSRRNYEREAGYPELDETIEISIYQKLWERDSVASRIIEFWAKESWKTAPDVFEDPNPETLTPFEESVKNLPMSIGDKTWRKEEEGSLLWRYLQQADELSGIGRFGILLLGYDDGEDLAKPVKGLKEKNSFGVRAKTETIKDATGGVTENLVPSVNYSGKGRYQITNNQVRGKTGKVKPSYKRNLIYLRPFSEYQVEIIEVEGNRTSPRYGRPVRYNVTINDSRDMLNITGDSFNTREVHWSRVIHLADTYHTASSSDILAVPRIRNILDEVLGVRKIKLSSPEGFWKGAYPPMKVTLLPGIDPRTPINVQEVKDELEEMFNSQDRSAILKGLDLNSMAPVVVDPNGQIDAQLQLICIKTGIPVRQLMGSEAGELSSAQDSTTVSGRAKARQEKYNTPGVVAPFIDRNIMVGALEEPSEWYTTWGDLTSLSKLEKAQITGARVQAMSGFVQSGLDMTLMSKKKFLTDEMDYPDDEAESMLQEVEIAAEEAQAEAMLQQEEQLAQQEEMVKKGLAPDPLDPAQQKLAQQQGKATASQSGKGQPGKKGENPFAGGQKGKAKPRIPGKGRMGNQL